MPNPKFDAVIAQMVETHNKKSADYAKDTNPYSNFEETAATAGCSVDTVFLVMIGVKLARLRELLASGKTAQNESVQDSRMDLAVYCALWASYHGEAKVWCPYCQVWGCSVELEAHKPKPSYCSYCCGPCKLG